MMYLTPFTKPERFIVCMHCGEGAFQVSHLPEGTQFGPWYCNNCGKSFVGCIFSQETVEVHAWHGVMRRVVDTLRCEVPAGWTIDVEGTIINGKRNASYQYEEHSCPSDFLRRVIEVYDANGASDPHGVFSFISSRDQD